jgi:glucose-1-phosphate thymidylyltransferase
MLSKAVLFAASGGVAGEGATAGSSRRPSDLPLSLLPVANRPLLLHALDALKDAGLREVAVVAASETASEARSAMARRTGGRLEVSYVEHDADGGLPAALSELEGFVGADPFVLHLGDSLSRESLGSLLQGPTAERGSTVLVQDGVADDSVVELASRRAGAGNDDGLAAGVWVFGAGSLQVLSETPTSGSTELDVLCGTRRLAELGGGIAFRPVGEWWRFRGRPDALLEANRFALEGLRPSPVEARLIDTRIQGSVSIHPSARLESSIVRGPAVIGPRAHLRDAYVGPYTSIGPDVVIEGAEVEHSIVLAEASIRHLGGRLEASVVGPRAKVFRDFRLPRALRLSVGEGAEVAVT